MIFAFCLPFIGTYSWLSFKKAVIKKEVKRELIKTVDHGSLIQLGFKVNEVDDKLKWEHPGEFEYNGQMFDIVSKSEKKDSVYYLCWPDHDETALNKKLEKLVSENFSNDKESNQKEKRLTDFGSNLFPPYSQNIMRILGERQFYFSGKEKKYPSIFNKPISPPPQSA